MDETLDFWIRYGGWASQRLDLLPAQRGAIVTGLGEVRAASGDPGSVQRIVDHLVWEQARIKHETTSPGPG